jgi:hypothetical protein
MTRIITASIIIVVTSCAQLDGGTVDREDDYSNAAMSWLGADIQEMLAVWPSPNMACGSNKVGQTGCVWWRQVTGIALGQGPMGHHCEVIARYDEAGVITEIDVRRSFDCHRLFKNDQFDRMTRRTSEKERTAIEE